MVDAGAHIIKISLITAAYNSHSTIVNALESVFCQTYSNVELIVIDGGSTDGTLEILQRYADKISIFVSEPDNGIYDALNKGIRYASGDVVGFLHADDLLADSHVLSRIAAGFSNHNVSAVYGDLQYVFKDDPSRIIRYWKAGEFNQRKLSFGWMPPHPTLYVRRSLFEKVGSFDTHYRIAADYEFILRLFSLPGFNPLYIPEVFVKMRMGGASNRSFSNILRKSYEDWNALRKNRVGGLGALICKNISKVRQFF